MQQTVAGSNAGVYYAAPLFDSPVELATYAQTSTLTDCSVFVPPLQLGPVTPGEHHFFAYSTQDNIRHYSTPGPPSDGSFGAVVDQIYSTFDARQTLEEFLVTCDGKLLAAVGADLSQRLLLRDQPGRVAAFAATALNVQPIVVGRLPG